MTFLRTALARLGLTLALLFVFLVASAFGPIFYLVVPTLAVLAIRKRYYFEAFVSVFGPSAIASGFAIANYASGSAKLHCMGLPGTEFFNIDPVYRCGRETGGCLVNGKEWIIEDPYNLTLRALVKVFGPERGSYTGPYPTEADATTALSSAIPIDLAAIGADQFDVGPVHVRLDTGVGKKLLDRWLGGLTVADIKAGGIAAELVGGPVTAVIWKNSVLIVRGPPSNPMIAAIDLIVGRPFAFNQSRQRFPPVMWRRADDL